METKLSQLLFKRVDISTPSRDCNLCIRSHTHAHTRPKIHTYTHTPDTRQGDDAAVGLFETPSPSAPGAEAHDNYLARRSHTKPYTTRV